MESYQDLNGEAVCGSKRYLQTLLREEMGFAGVLVTDWAEIQQLNVFHKTAATPKEAVRIAIGETSIDLSMVPSDTTFFDYLVELVQEGAIPESRIDESVARILQLKEDLGVSTFISVFCFLLLGFTFRLFCFVFVFCLFFESKDSGLSSPRPKQPPAGNHWWKRGQGRSFGDGAGVYLPGREQERLPAPVHRQEEDNPDRGAFLRLPDVHVGWLDY